MSEAWSNFYTSDEINSIHRIELDSLDVVKTICEALNIKFFMYGGSLLGTIKYNGFVPWDDDLDVAMLREDYDKFIAYAPGILPAEYEIQHPKINRRTPYPYIKLRRKDTALVEYRNHKVKINHGVYFDIYPIDHIPDDYVKLIKQKLAFDRWTSIFLVRQNFRTEETNSIPKRLMRESIRFIQSMVAHLLPLDYIMRKIDRISTAYNDCQTHYQGNLFFPKPVNYFDGTEFQKAEFEGREVYIPSGYKINLKNRYGDIGRLPPENKRVGHKPYILYLGEDENNDD